MQDIHHNYRNNDPTPHACTPQTQLGIVPISAPSICGRPFGLPSGCVGPFRERTVLIEHRFWRSGFGSRAICEYGLLQAEGRSLASRVASMVVPVFFPSTKPQPAWMSDWPERSAAFIVDDASAHARVLCDFRQDHRAVADVRRQPLASETLSKEILDQSSLMRPIVRSFAAMA